MWFSLKLGFCAFFGISRKNWDFRQNIWISGARGRPEIHKNARNPNFLPNPNIWKTTWEGPWETKSNRKTEKQRTYITKEAGTLESVFFLVFHYRGPRVSTNGF